MKKFLVNLYDRETKKRKAQLVVKAESQEEAFSIAVDYYNRRVGTAKKQEK